MGKAVLVIFAKAINSNIKPIRYCLMIEKRNRLLSSCVSNCTRFMKLDQSIDRCSYNIVKKIIQISWITNSYDLSLYRVLCEKLKHLKYIFKSFKPLRGLRKIKI